MTAPPGGCGRKLDAVSLSQLLQSSGFERVERTDFVDSVALERPVSSRLHSSVDLIFDLGLPGNVTGTVAVTHALSDLYASFCLPLSATLCLGLSLKARSDGSAADLLRAARTTLLENDVQFGGGHTVYNDAMFLSVSVLGERATASKPIFDPGREYDLLISKPIGTGIYLAANRAGLLSRHDVDALERQLMESNARAGQEALTLLDSGRGNLAMLTDVTGFGLLQTVRAEIPAGWAATLMGQSVPLLPRTIDLIENQGITTTLGDANIVTSIDDAQVSVSTSELARLSALSDPQTSGGLLMALDSVLTETSDLGAYWRKVGRVVQETSMRTAVVSLL